MCGPNNSAPTPTVIHGADERKYSARRASASAATPKPASRKIDQYLPIMAAAAPTPASAAHNALRVSYERTKNHVAIAQSGISTVLALYFNEWKLKKGMNVSSSR